MIVLTVLKDSVYVAERGKGAGNEIRRITAFAVDNYNYSIAVRSNGENFVSKLWYPNFTMMQNSLSEYEVDKEKAAALLTQTLRFLFDKEQGSPLSFEEIDVEFNVSARNNIGELKLYKTLAEKFGSDENEDDDGDGDDGDTPKIPKKRGKKKSVVVEIPEFEGMILLGTSKC